MNPSAVTVCCLEHRTQALTSARAAVWCQSFTIPLHQCLDNQNLYDSGWITAPGRSVKEPDVSLRAAARSHRSKRIKSQARNAVKVAKSAQQHAPDCNKKRLSYPAGQVA